MVAPSTFACSAQGRWSLDMIDDDPPLCAAVVGPDGLTAFVDFEPGCRLIVTHDRSSSRLNRLRRFSFPRQWL